ncbi:MAG: SDR family NAD(P)-dependent oxidoreductase, partial [Bacteroidetes bacterium]|nr:SDR family NAD(P)-dependent oxidoreductase [Bacteroidota bacterium]
PSILFITRQADQVLPTDTTINFNQSALYGLGRVMMNEYPFIPLSLIDIDGQETALQNLLRIYGQPQATKVSEWALRAGECFVRRLQPVNEAQDVQQATALTPALGTSFTTLIKEEGMLDSLQFRQQQRRKPAAGEVEIKVHAAGLNFKDIMNGMGLLSEEAVAGGVAGKSLGLECAGVVSAIGPGVKDLKVGDAVMAWAANSFSGYAITQETCVASKPETLSFAEAAGITVVYLTAYYSLHYLARMEAGEKVLIHSATGGVGLAAIQLARKAGAEIYATAGSDEKRDYLRSLGIKYVYDSRKADFADKILQDTAGTGVDIVLNSLSGKGIIQSIRCLAPFGRFIEIGKADIYKDSKLALKRFGQNLSYFAVDLDRLMLQKPALGKRLFLELCAQFHAGELKAGPTKTYPLAELQEALQYISKGAHMGKVVVSMEATAIPLLPATALQLDTAAYYLVTGGASGFGLELGRWLVQKGARYLILASRSGSKSDYDCAMVQEMEALGCRVWLPKLDITDEAAVQQLADQLKGEDRVLKGIIHSAAVLEDATLANMDEARFMRVFNPKVLGAWNLHRAMLDQPVDFFISLSSISSVFGLPGQSNYSSANNFLDKLALYRQSIGLAGSSVNLGVLGMYAGMSKEGGQVLNVLANQGWLPLSLRQVTGKIENVILMQRPQRMAANLDLKRFRDFFSHLQDDSRFAHLLKADQLRVQGGSGGGTLADQIMGQEPVGRAAMLEGLLAAALAKILGTSAEKIAIDLSISKIGLDSLMLNQLRNWIQQKLEINYPLMKIAKGPSIQELAAQLLEELGTEEGA